MTGEEILFGRYRVLKLLGRGGAGRVYLVEDLQDSGIRKALKLVELRPGREEIFDQIRGEQRNAQQGARPANDPFGSLPASVRLSWRGTILWFIVKPTGKPYSRGGRALCDGGVALVGPVNTGKLTSFHAV